jgi:isopenicillin-N epimerase
LAVASQGLFFALAGNLNEIRGNISKLDHRDLIGAGGITSFRLRGQTGEAQNKALAAALLKRFNIFTVARAGVACGSCIRVTAAIFTSEAEIDKLIAALKILSA